MTRVSICIPAYNNAEGLRRLLQSVKAQRYQDYEVVVTDDSTDDRVEEAVRRFLPPSAEAIPALRYYRNDVRLGSTANWNEAIARSSGEYIKMMHHDDWFADSEALGKFAAMLDSNPQADLAYSGTCQVRLEKQGGEARPRHQSASDEALLREDYRNLFLGNTVGSPSAVISRRKPFGYDEELTWLVDMEFYLHLLSGAPCFVCTQEPLICIGESGLQLTDRCIGDRELNLREYRYIYHKYHLEREQSYRDKMLRVLIEYHGSRRMAAACGIPAEAYRKAVRVRRADNVGSYLRAGIRKLTGR